MKKLTQLYYEGEMYQIGGGSGTIDATINVVGAADTHYINDRYRDHAGDMNFVNPMHRFFGWYVPNRSIVKSNKNIDVADTKFIYSPTVRRWAFDDPETSIDAASGIKNIIFPAYCTEFTTQSSMFNTRGQYKNDLTGETIVIKPKTYSTFERHVVIQSGNHHPIDGRPTERFNTEFPKINTGKKTVVLDISIDWDMLPPDSYIRWEVLHHKVTYESVKFSISHAHRVERTVNANGPIKSMFDPDNMQTLTLDSTKDCYVGANCQEYAKNMLKYPGKKFTRICLMLTGNGANIDSATGLIFDVFINQRYYREACIGLGQKEFLYITNPTKNVGVLRNTSGALTQFGIPVSFPKTGDILKVIDAPAPEVNKEIEMKTYLCLNAHGGDNIDTPYNNVITESGGDAHMDTLRYAYPLPHNYDPVFEKWYFSEGVDHAYLSRFKRVKPV